MAATQTSFLSVILYVAVAMMLSGAKPSYSAREFTMINDCNETIWPAVTPGDTFNGGGFTLKPGQSISFRAPVGWVGRIWARTGCKFTPSGNGTCETGSCGTALQCKSRSGSTPTTLAEFTLSATDFYDVSLVDGFNVPVVVTPINGTGNCTVAGCDHDLRRNCPPELQMKVGGKIVGCKSACDVYGTDAYCCRGVYGNPVVCRPTDYSKRFKESCPTAYSYAYDDPTSIFTCSASDYIVRFCSSRDSPVCTYHNDKQICSSSQRLRALSFFILPLILLFIHI